MNTERYIQTFRRPLSKKIFKDPVLASDNFFYERQSILKWLEEKTTSPRTEKVMTNELRNYEKLNESLNKLLEDNKELKAEQYKLSKMFHKEYKLYVDKIISDKKYELLLDIFEFNTNVFTDDVMKDIIKTNEKIVTHIIDNIQENDNNIMFYNLIFKHGTSELSKYAIDKCYDLECENKYKWRPINYICRYSTPEVIRLY